MPSWYPVDLNLYIAYMCTLHNNLVFQFITACSRPLRGTRGTFLLRKMPWCRQEMRCRSDVFTDFTIIWILIFFPQILTCFIFWINKLLFSFIETLIYVHIYTALKSYIYIAVISENRLYMSIIFILNSNGIFFKHCSVLAGLMCYTLCIVRNMELLFLFIHV
jgi:hypothetical protein